MRTLRLAILVGLMIVLQVAVFPHLRLAGVVPDLGLIVAIAVGYQLGPEAGADLADALTAQIPYWREAAATKDPEAHEKAVTEAELAHSAGGEVARARDLIGLAPVITE